MRLSNYDKKPYVEVKGFDQDVFLNYENIGKEIKSKLKKEKNIIVIDCYIGVRINEIIEELKSSVNFNKIIISDDLALEGVEITKKISDYLTDDRVFGKLSTFKLTEFFDEKKLKDGREIINNTTGNILIIGTGAEILTSGDILIYADLARWEIQQRFRTGELSNWKVNNHDEDILRKYKRAFFVEWRMCDRHKKTLFDKIDYLLDTNIKNEPKMISGKAFNTGLEKCVNRPFRVVPFFDPGVWGGQWMKEVCQLDKSKKNYAWCFDCVPEENSLYLKFGETVVEIPSINLVFKKPKELLGERVYGRFGTEFPIRFDFLDTIDGQNLSLQVHPTTEYIQEKFGMHYTQDESYYILDAKEDANVYLGVKENINKDEFINDLKKSEKGEIIFDDDKYVNKFPAKKHDHFLIPAGTVHCSGSGTMVLEISATPYIFTFKLWDWQRVGLDGIPRPVHIEHGKEVIDFTRDTTWALDNIVNIVEEIKSEEGIREEKTGLHERQFIETRRHWFTKKVKHKTNGSVNVLNLVEGEEAVVKSVNNSFEPFVVHYVETFIIPENVKEYTIEPYGKSIGKEIATIKAYVRG